MEHQDTKQTSMSPRLKELNDIPYIVAPHVGAWIETSGINPYAVLGKSLPMWERGLKHRHYIAHD